MSAFKTNLPFIYKFSNPDCIPPLKDVFSDLKWVQGWSAPFQCSTTSFRDVELQRQTRKKSKDCAKCSWDLFPCNYMYTAFTLISFVTMKPRPSFLSSPLRHVHSVRGGLFGRCWFTLNCDFWLPWELSRLRHRQVVCVLKLILFQFSCHCCSTMSIKGNTAALNKVMGQRG